MPLRAAPIFALILATALATAHAETHIVQVTDGEFIPKHIHIVPGDTVTWQWSATTMGHDVHAGFTADRSPASYQGAFSSPLQTSGSFSQTFSTAFLSANPSSNNVYHYYCEPHQFTGMTGSVSILNANKAHATTLTGAQAGTSSSATGSCTLSVAANDSQITVSCTHNVSGATTARIFHSGAFGATGTQLCSFSAGSINNQTCATNASIIDSLLAGQMYIVIASGSNPNGEIRGQFHVQGGSARITGVVRDQNGSRLEGVTVVAGSSSGVSNVFGNYEIANVPNGVYVLTASVSGGTVAPNSGVNPVFVNNIDVENKDFTATVTNGGGNNPPPDNGSADTDGDGVTNGREDTDGSNKLDRGSYKDHLSSPLYVLWNGFLGMINILEILNTGNQPLNVTVKLYDINGQLVSTTPLAVVARGQFDLILNDVPGFQVDSYGVAALEFDNLRADDLEGRVFFYRPDTVGGYEFAFGVPFVTPLRNTTSVGFNTYQPSINPAESRFLVFQWLALVNLDPQKSLSFNIFTFDMLGALLTSRQVTVPPFGRVDLSGGHEDPGPSNVGQHLIVPANNGPYMAQLFRYGSNAEPGIAPSKYFFAFPLLAHAGNGEPQAAPISRVDGSENWLELVNAHDEPVSVNVRFFGANGALKAEQNVLLGAYQQQHMHASGILAPNETGQALITPSTAESVIGQSMFYFRNSAGTIETMYGSSIRETFGRNLYGSYNRFLGMANRLKLSNQTSVSINATVRVFDQLGLLREVNVPLGAYASTELQIHSAVQFNTRPDTFGVIEVQTNGNEQVFSELLRVRPIATGGIDFAAPTLMR